MGCLGNCAASKWGRGENSGHGRWGWHSNLYYLGVYALLLPVTCNSTDVIGLVWIHVTIKYKVLSAIFDTKQVFSKCYLC